jgi:hypothetical protein
VLPADRCQVPPEVVVSTIYGYVFPPEVEHGGALRSAMPTVE